MVTTYDVVPGQSIGPFQLGDSLWHILDLLRTHKVEYPKIEISWDPEDSIKSAVVIHLPHITLYFPASPHQALQLICVPSISEGFILTYEEHTLSSTSLPLTRGRVGRVLGPTYAGSSQAKLVYPGIAFDLAGNGDREDRVRGLSVKPRDDGEGKVISPLKRVVVQPGKGVTLHLPDPLEIILGSTTAQDLLLDLGPPLRKFYKEDDRLERMWGTAAQDSEKGSCFWNYFHHGLDFLVSPSGLVIKVILHSNIPGTPLFQRYARCPWSIPSSSGDLDYTSPLSQFRSGLSGTSSSATNYTPEIRLTVPTTNTGGGGEGKKKKSRGGSPSSLSSANSALSTTKSTEDLSTTNTTSASRSAGGSRGSRAQENEEDAMVLDRVGEGGLDGVKGVGTSRLVGFDGLVVEEDQQSGGICSVLVWHAAGSTGQ